MLDRRAGIAIEPVALERRFDRCAVRSERTDAGPLGAGGRDHERIVTGRRARGKADFHEAWKSLE